jgi:beta-lactamase class A
MQIQLPTTVTWSVQLGSADTGDILFEHQPETVCATASIGKILLLVTVAERIADGALSPARLVTRLGVTPVADSGLWQHLCADALPVADVCSLVGATSDNLATNALIDLVGLDAVASTASRLGFSATALHDVVRDVRRPEHASALSSGNARELFALCCELASPRVLTRVVTETVTGWLSLNIDLSLVAGSFGLDPLAHVNPDRDVRLWNKTGTNVGVRCDVGLVTHGGQRVAYAVLANWTVSNDRDPQRDEVIVAMRAIGQATNDWLVGARR